MNLGDVKQRVRRTFGDESGSQLESDDITRWVNDAQREAVLQNEGLLETTATLDMVAGTNTYSLSSNVFSLHRIRIRTSTSNAYFWVPWSSGTDFERYVDGWDNSTDRGTPRLYTEKNKQIILYPTPDVSVTAGIKYEYSRMPTAIADGAADSTALDLPEYYHQYIVDYCLMQAYEMDEDLDAHMSKAQTVQATLDFNETRENWYGRDKYPVIQDYIGDEW